MEYDVFTNCKEVARAISNRVGRDYLVDTTVSDESDIYQFFNFPESLIYRNRDLLENNSEGLEIRDSGSGEIIWPSQKVFNLWRALDIL